jgi:hypothetical protein
MKRTGNWWKLGFVVWGIFLPLLALGCNSMKQTRYPSIYEVDRTETVPRIWPKQSGASEYRRDSGCDHDRRVVIHEGRVDETSGR